MNLFKTAKKFNVTLATIILLSQLMFFILVYQETCDPLVEAILRSIGTFLVYLALAVTLFFISKRIRRLSLFDWVISLGVLVYASIYLSFSYLELMYEGVFYDVAHAVFRATAGNVSTVLPVLLVLLVVCQFIYWFKRPVGQSGEKFKHFLTLLKFIFGASLFFLVTLNINNSSWPVCEYEWNQIPDFNPAVIE